MTTDTKVPTARLPAKEPEIVNHPSLEEREITLPPRDYQPTKAETEQEVDMPGADIVTVRKAFFRRIKVREEKPEGC